MRTCEIPYTRRSIKLGKTPPLSIQDLVVLAEVAPVEPRKSPKECPVATPEAVVPVYTAKPLNNSPVRSLSIGLRENLTIARCLSYSK